MAEEVGLIPACGLLPCGAALRAVFASSRRSNCVFIPPSGLRIRFADYGGGGGIRTHGTLRLSGFQDRRNRPLCHPSFAIIISSLFYQDNRQESCPLPIYCQLNECPAIQDAGNSMAKYTDRESVFASFSSLLTAKFQIQTYSKQSLIFLAHCEADPDWLDFMTHLQLGIAVDL